ncbi:MAG: beta-lactamase family protein [Gemmatimonadota bacterium]|nr:beta-lactamase family protein [Gemmatimonadota bacterium]
MPRCSRRTLLASLLAIAGALPGPAIAQSPRRFHKPVRPTDRQRVGASPAQAALRDTLQAILDRGVADSAFPGAVAVIGSHAGPLVTVTAGHLDWAPSPAPTVETLWDIASLTKVVGMTSAMMQLVEGGQVNLDAPVQRYLPEWTGPGKDRVTVRDLITHRSGLPAFKQYFKLNVSPDSTLRLFFTTPLDTTPGVRMVYSDIGAILLGKIVERVSGERLDAYLWRYVFAPLGMRDTRYRPDSSLLSRIAPTEMDPWRGRHLRGEVHDENAAALGGVSAHAGLFSTANDLGRLARVYLNGGALDSGRLARAATIRQFTTVQDSTFSSRALGWDTPSANSSAGHFITRPAFGHTGFTGTSLWIAPQHDLYVLLLTNRVNPTREHSRIGPVRVAVADAAMRALHPDVVQAIELRAASASPSSTARP